MRRGVSCNENRFFPVRIELQGVSCKPYRVWVCSDLLRQETTTMDPLGFKVCLILAAQVLRRRWRHFTTALCHFLFSNSSLSLLQILQECHFDDNKKIEVKASV